MKGETGAPSARSVACSICGAAVPELAIDAEVKIDHAHPGARGGGFILVHAWGSSQYVYPFCATCFGRWDPRRFVEVQLESLRAIATGRPRPVRVHLLERGRAACAREVRPELAVPGRWPEGHIWTHAADFDALAVMGGGFANLAALSEKHGHPFSDLAKTALACAECRTIHWNQAHPVGRAVTVRRDDGETVLTKTRSAAWALADRAVVSVEGISGCYDLDRVTPVMMPTS